MKWVMLLALLLLVGCTSEDVSERCVPAECCHASSCVHDYEAQHCAGVMCSEDCVPGTMDCLQGHCENIDGNCEVVWD